MTDTRYVSRLAFYSIIVAFAVMGIKFVAWWLTGSVALYSDALESIVNVIAATIAWIAIRISHKPADLEQVGFYLIQDSQIRDCVILYEH